MIGAAPNRARIRARCEDVTRSADSPRKWMLRMHLVEVEQLHGGQFLRAGERVDAIAFDLASPPRPGDTVLAEAEYLGGPRAGLVQLYDLTTM